MALEFFKPQAAPQKQNILLYGPPGTGKTVGACSAPGPILAVNAEGPVAFMRARAIHGSDKIHEVPFVGADTLKDVFLHLKAGGEEKTVVIDSLGEVYRMLIEEMSGTDARPSLQNYGDANTKIERFVRSLRDLSVNVVLVAHEQVDDMEGALTRRPATGGKKLPEQIMAQMDIVAYTAALVSEESEERQYVGQLVEANGRRAKDRSGGLGKFRPLDLTDWINTAVKAMTTAPKAVEEAA